MDAIQDIVSASYLLLSVRHSISDDATRISRTQGGVGDMSLGQNMKSSYAWDRHCIT